MATKTPEAEAAPAAPPAKSKKMLLIIIVGVLALVLIGGGAFIFLKKQHAADEEGAEEDAPAAHHEKEHAGPPIYLPLDVERPMVVNLADPGGERVAQIGITLELNGPAATDVVKAYLPSIRSEVLMLISQRTAEELLKREGKEQLASDILSEASKHFSEEPASAKGGKKNKKAEPEGPIRGVLFSSFIVQ